MCAHSACLKQNKNKQQQKTKQKQNKKQNKTKKKKKKKGRRSPPLPSMSTGFCVSILVSRLWCQLQCHAFCVGGILSCVVGVESHLFRCKSTDLPVATLSCSILKRRCSQSSPFVVLVLSSLFHTCRDIPRGSLDASVLMLFLGASREICLAASFRLALQCIVIVT